MLTRLIAAFLFGVTTRDPLVFVAVPLLLTAVALAGVSAARPPCRARGSGRGLRME